MVLGDLPARYEPSFQFTNVAEHARVETDARDRLSADALFLVAHESTRKSGEKMIQDVLNIGAVDKMALPTGWVKGAEQNHVGGQGSTSQFLAPGKSDVEITFFDRGFRYHSNGAAFREVLKKPPHVLSPQELKDLGSILGNYSDPRAFTMSACRTEDINGKRVVVIEGKWNAEGHQSYSLLTDPEGKGETVQEIYYKAPAADYKTYLQPALQAMKSIRWK